MNSNELIREKQKLWATRKGVQMRTDSYTLNPDQNVLKGYLNRQRIGLRKQMDTNSK